MFTARYELNSYKKFWFILKSAFKIEQKLPEGRSSLPNCRARVILRWLVASLTPPTRGLARSSVGVAFLATKWNSVRTSFDSSIIP